MISKNDITGAIDAIGIQWAEPDFAPRKPPEPPYAYMRDTLEYDGSDERTGMVGHDTRVYLMDDGSPLHRRNRVLLARELARRGVHFRQYPSEYSYELKLFETEYDIYETYFEKWSDEQ